MKVIAAKMKSIWSDESAQGSTEYILLLAVVAVIGFLFKNKIKDIITNKLTDVEGGVNRISAQE